MAKSEEEIKPVETSTYADRVTAAMKKARINSSEKKQEVKKFHFNYPKITEEENQLGFYLKRLSMNEDFKYLLHVNAKMIAECLQDAFEISSMGECPFSSFEDQQKFKCGYKKGLEALKKRMESMISNYTESMKSETKEKENGEN